MTFQEWWLEQKEGVCFDIVKRLGLDLQNPLHEALLMHVACQAWVAGQMTRDDEKPE